MGRAIVLACAMMFSVFISSSTALAQRPGEDRPAGGPPPRNNRDSTSSVEAFVQRMMKFDKDNKGELKRDDITDPRLVRLFDRADANHDGVVTKEELTTLAKAMAAESNSAGGRRNGPGSGFDGPPRGGPGDQGPPDDRRGPGGAGGPPPGPPQPGQVLGGRIVEDLELSDDQKSQLAELQKLVDERLSKILNDKQKRRLEEFKRRGPGGPPPGPGPDRPND